MADLEDIERRIKRIENKLGIVNEYPYTFEDIVGVLDHRTLEQIWKGMDTPETTIPLIGLNRELLLKLKPTFSKTRWNEMAKELSAPFTKETTLSTIRHSREKILDRILQLENQGEIVVGREEGKGYLSLDELRGQKEPFVDVQSWLHSTFEKV